MPKKSQDAAPAAAAPRTRMRVKVDDVLPHVVTYLCESVAPGAEAPRDEQLPLLAAGLQSHVPLYDGGRALLSGGGLHSAALAAGAEEIEVELAPGAADLPPDRVALLVAGEHFAAYLARVRPQRRDGMLVAAALYGQWLGWCEGERHPTRREHRLARPGGTKRERIRRAFGASQRTLIRLRTLLDRGADELVEAYRLGRLGDRHVEAACRLTAEEQREYAARLGAGGDPRALAAEYIGAGRRTRGRAAPAIKAAIRAIAVEAEGRPEVVRLTAEELELARKALGFLQGWVAAPSAPEPGEALAAVLDRVRKTG